MKRKRAVTLIEIMIVILLIGLIGGALAYNMSGSLDQGKVFKTEQNITRAHDILMMEYAKSNLSLDDILRQKTAILSASPLIKNGETLLQDGWNEELQMEIVDGDIEITSERLQRFNA